MAINKRIFFFFIFTFFLLILWRGTINSNNYSVNKKTNCIPPEYSMDLKPNELELPDKVFSFLAPNDQLNFVDLYLEEKFMYYIYLELVTPHNISTLKISIWDPDGKKFDIFESEMFYNPEYGRYFEIPFGTVKSGAYNITIITESELNFNLYISITQGSRCLYDKISSDEIESIVFYKITRFDNGKNIDHKIELKTDYMYKCYIGRVSAISIEENNEVRIDYSITDSNDVEFVIYKNTLMTDINGINFFNFGTAVKGEYTIDITIYCAVPYVNIAYLFVEDYPISEVIDANETELDHSDEGKTTEKIILEQLTSHSIFSLPQEWLIATIISSGGLIGGTFIAVQNYRKKRDVSFNLKAKGLKNKIL
jgi:hypothetical protein